jgi:hypothetical protein
VAVNLTSGSQAVSCLASDIVSAALLEIAVTASGENPSPEDAAWGLQKLQRLIDQFNARRELIFAMSFLQFTTVANLAPHTIGPSGAAGNFNVPIRPVNIVGASFILNSGSSNPVYTPIRIRDHDWWNANPIPSLETSIITDLYYDPTSPLGTLNFYPICNVSNPVRLEIWNALTQAITLQTPLGFAQGYWDAIVVSLAVRLWPSFFKSEPVPPDLKEQMREAMRVIEANNDGPPRIDISGGMPSSRLGGRPDFDFLTGLDDNY